MNKIRSLDSIRCIAVQHILPSTYEFILALKSTFKNLTIFAKPKSINESVKINLEKHGIDIRVAKRDVNVVDYYLDGDIKTKTVVLDIGGYFSDIEKIRSVSIVGIVEDTENGYQKYKKIVVF